MALRALLRRPPRDAAAAAAAAAAAMGTAAPRPPRLLHLPRLPDSAPLLLLHDDASTNEWGRKMTTSLRARWGDGPPRTVLLIKKPRSEESTTAAQAIAAYIARRYPSTTLLVEPSELPLFTSAHSFHCDDDTPNQLSRTVDCVITVGGGEADRPRI